VAARRAEASALQAAATAEALLASAERDMRDAQDAHQGVLWDYNRRLRDAEGRAAHEAKTTNRLLARVSWLEVSLAEALAALQRQQQGQGQQEQGGRCGEGQPKGCGAATLSSGGGGCTGSSAPSGS
jgi:hypothetical protein